jgi:hypothetical protein
MTAQFAPTRERGCETTLSTAFERSLARLSADEIVAALGLADAPHLLRTPLRAALFTFSLPLGRTLARFDARIETCGVAHAAASVLADLGATWRRDGSPPPARGPLLVVANHPGAYDALVLLAALGRDDAAILASDRPALRAMSSFARHLIFVPVATASVTAKRMQGLRVALNHLSQGHALVHFGAGRIEPDPAFPVDAGVELLARWQSGTGALVRGTGRAGGAVVAAVVEGVHSPRAKRLWVTRVAERHGLTTLAPLLQIGLRRYQDVAARVCFAAPTPAASLVARGGDDAGITARARDRTRALLMAT